jgi:hypothetical protein
MLREADSLAEQAPASLAGKLAASSTDALANARSRLASKHTPDLLRMYREALTVGKRLAAFMLADALTARRMPPCFRSVGHLSVVDGMQSFDLLAHDLQWIRAMYPEHHHKAKGGHAGMLHGDSWVATTEHYRATKNRGDTWLIVRQLALTDDQQWECVILRSAPVKRAAHGLDTRKEKVERTIENRRLEANRTHRGHYPLEHAYERRFKVWVCGEMAGHSQTKAARLYGMWTGSEITRSVAHEDLEWVRAHIPESRTSRKRQT